MKTIAISNRNHPPGQPHRPALSDPTNAAVLIRDGLNRLGIKTSLIHPERAFNARPVAMNDDWLIVPPLPYARNRDLEALLRRNGRASIAWRPGAAQLGMLPQIVEDRLVEVVHLSIDRLNATFGVYDTEQALRRLGMLNPGLVVVATNPQTAVALANGVIHRQPAFRLHGPAVGEGKSAAFFSAWFATWRRTGDMPRALIAGHANAASVAGSWEPVKALLNRRQIEEFVEPLMEASARVGAARQPLKPTHGAKATASWETAKGLVQQAHVDAYLEPALTEPAVQTSGWIARVAVAAGLVALCIRFVLFAAGAL